MTRFSNHQNGRAQHRKPEGEAAYLPHAHVLTNRLRKPPPIKAPMPGNLEAHPIELIEARPEGLGPCVFSVPRISRQRRASILDPDHGTYFNRNRAQEELRLHSRDAFDHPY